VGDSPRGTGDGLNKNSEACLNRKFMEMVKLLNIYLNHFPRHERHALAGRIRNTAYELYDLSVNISTACN
jgi:hypothetical protein